MIRMMPMAANMPLITAEGKRPMTRPSEISDQLHDARQDNGNRNPETSQCFDGVKCLQLNRLDTLSCEPLSQAKPASTIRRSTRQKWCARCQ